MDSRKKEIFKQAKRFHARHPEVWKLFKKFTLERIEKGFKHYSAYAIFEQIRWHTDVPNEEGRSSFKLNNTYRPVYSREFMKKFPQHAGFFRTRRQISEDKKATNLPELTPSYFDNR